MTKVYIKKLNETYLKLASEPHVIMELSNYFTFDAPNGVYMKGKNGWGGKLRLFDRRNNTIYTGLNKYIELFCRDMGYECVYTYDPASAEFSLKESRDFINTLNLPFTVRDYQEDTFLHCIRERRSLILSPTASGKSLVIYLLTRYYNANTLIIVPTVGLVHQLASDFASYGFESDKFIHKIYQGQSTETDKRIIISTWQSIYELDPVWYNKFNVVIGDEAHLFKASSLKRIMNNLSNCKYRIGVTGTIDNSETHKLVLEGLFGTVRKIISTAELIKKKVLSDFNIKIIVLSYPEAVRKLISNSKDYDLEMKYIISNKARNNFIKNLVLSLEGNSLLLFQYVDKHGKILYDIIKNEIGNDRNVYYIDGEVDGEDRDLIRAIIEKEKDAILIASYGTLSTGVNIVNLKNLIFAGPSKSKIRNLQSIGRVLRRSETSTNAILYDIADDFSWNGINNYTLNHFIERIKIYSEEEFLIKTYNVSLYNK